MTIKILRFDSEIIELNVPKNCNIKEIKLEIEIYFNKELKEKNINWKYIWKNYELKFMNKTLRNNTQLNEIFSENNTKTNLFVFEKKKIKSLNL